MTLRVPLLRPPAARDFRLVWLGEALSLPGDSIYFVALTRPAVQPAG